MGTATCRRAVVAVAVALALASAAGGCGGSGKTTPTASASAFAWLRPAPAPASWHTVTIPTGATMAYPAGWRLAHGDKGTATAVLLTADHGYLGFLNVTPRQGNERMSTWSSFRVAHNEDEGDRHVTTLATGTALTFRNGRGSCVRDSYATVTKAAFVEIACLVTGPRATSVIVGAAPPGDWTRYGPTIERAISAFTT